MPFRFAPVGRSLLIGCGCLLFAVGCSPQAPERVADKATSADTDKPARADTDAPPDDMAATTPEKTNEPVPPQEVEPVASPPNPTIEAREPAVEPRQIDPDELELELGLEPRGAAELKLGEPGEVDLKLDKPDDAPDADAVGPSQVGVGGGVGFASPSMLGKVRVRFIRLQYSGGDWNHNFGIGGDLNMLTEYGLRTKTRIAENTESRTISQLANFRTGVAPPVVYLTGQRDIALADQEIKILREYLTDKHGLLFADAGSQHFHEQFLALMKAVFPDDPPETVPLDDEIHQDPYKLPLLPIVAPHGGKDALGWKIDGRWVCYYHPGDIGGAWRDGHSDVSRKISELSYQLGTNVIFYAHVEYGKWLSARAKQR